MAPRDYRLNRSLALGLILLSAGCGPDPNPATSPPAAAPAPAAKAAPTADDLYAAATNGTPERVQSLLAEAPALAKSADRGGNSALHFAARAGRKDVVGRLLDQGADPNLPNHQQRTPLILAIENQHRETALLLLERGADTRIETPLIFAAKMGDKEVVAALLAKGADVNAPFGEQLGGKTAMHEAASAEIAQLLFDAGADVNGYKYSDPPLATAAERGNLALMKWLLANGADRGPGLVDMIAQRALKNHRPEVVDLLARDETIDPSVRTRLAALKGDRLAPVLK